MQLFAGAKISHGLESKRAEKAVRESEERARLIVDTASDAFVAVDATSIIVDWNRQAETIFGWSRQEAIGLPWVETMVPQRYREAHLRDLHRFLATDEDSTLNRRIESVALHRDGHEFPVELSMTLLRLGGTYVFNTFIRDITERRAVERMKEEFVSLVSHELRTPLTSIRGSLGLLAGGVLGPLSKKGKRMLDIAVANTDRLIRLLNDILDIERMASGQVIMQKQVCYAADLMAQAAEVMQAMAEKAEVSLSVAPVSVRLQADPDRMLQTLTNLLSNAIKFSPPGATVQLSAERHEGVLSFMVRDQGRGIPADKLDSIFERFQQVHTSDRRDKGGTGLGLAICRSIVQQHGGHIWAESTPG
ncbi:MAG: sensor histidine kinase, partial [Candidatus Binatia bacterium]